MCSMARVVGVEVANSACARNPAKIGLARTSGSVVVSTAVGIVMVSRANDFCTDGEDKCKTKSVAATFSSLCFEMDQPLYRTRGEVRNPVSVIMGNIVWPTFSRPASYIGQFQGPSMIIAASDWMNCDSMFTTSEPVRTTPCTCSRE